MPIPQTVTVAAPIAPSSEGDTYPVTDPKYGKGALRTVANVNERNSISSERREVGMIVYQQDTGIYYTLINGTENANWTQLLLLTPDQNGNIHIQGNLIVSGYIETDTGIQGNVDQEQEYLGNGMIMDCGNY